MTATKVIIVSPEEVYTYMASLYHNPTAQGGWDIQPHVETVSDFWNGLQSGYLPSDSDIVIFNDSSLVQGDEEEYQQLVAALTQLAEHALIIVLFYDYDNNYGRIQSDVMETAKASQVDLYRFYGVNTQENDMNYELSKVMEEYSTQPRIIATAAQLANVQAEPERPMHSAPSFPPAADHATPAVQHEPQASQRGKILVSTSSKGGSGKTTVALCTGTMLYYASVKAVELGLREKPLNIVLVDLDIRDGQIGLNIGVTVPTALNILIDDSNEDGVPSKETIRENLVYAEPLGIHTLLAPKRPRTAAHLDPGFYQNIISQLTEMFDIVILDTSVNYMDTLLAKVALPMADSIMFVGDMSAGAIYGMTRWVDEVTTEVEKGGSGIDINKIGIIINKSARNLGVDSEILSQASNGAEIVCAIPLDSAAVIAASNHRRLNDIIQQHDLISPAYYEIVQYFFPEEVLADPLISRAAETEAKARQSEPAPQGRGRTLNNPKDTAPKKRLFGR